jgi:Flp pilus assembly protein TadG
MKRDSIIRAIGRRAACQKGGTAMMEFALLIFFILIPLMAGLFELGRAFYHHQMMNEALRVAGRYLSRVETYGAACGTAPAANTPERAAANLALFGNVDGSGSPLLAYWNAYDEICIRAPRTETRTVSVGGQNQTINVEVIEIMAEAQYRGLGVLNLAGLGDLMISAQHEERVIRE